MKVELGQRKGRIVVEFGSVEDLERIAELMNRRPPAPSSWSRESHDRERARALTSTDDASPVKQRAMARSTRRA